MASHMKTTVQIPDALLGEVQKIARKKNTTLRALVQEGLQHVVAQEKEMKPFSLRDASVGGTGLQSEFKGASWDEIREAVYEGRGS